MSSSQQSWAALQAMADRLGCDVLDLLIGNYGQVLRLDGRIVARKVAGVWSPVMEGNLDRA
jgi:hypothetical protein